VCVMQPFSRIQVDCWTPKCVSNSGHKHVLVCIDTFSMGVKLYPLKSVQAAEIVPHLIDLYATYGGVTETMLTDDGSAFRSEMMKAFTLASKMVHRMSLPDHHTGTGYVEHECWQVCVALRALLLDNEKLNMKRWPEFLPIVEWVRNSTPRLTRAGLTPRMLLNPSFDKKARLLEHPDMPKKYSKHANEWLATQKRLIELVRVQLADWMDARLQHIRTEGAVSNFVFEKGDFVLAHNMQKIARNKMLRAWLGPYEVIEVHVQGSNTYQLCEVLTGDECVHHRDDLKLYHFRSMDNLVPMSMKGTDYVEIADVLSHTGTFKKGAGAYRFKVVGEDGQQFECDWESVNRSNAYIEYQRLHPDLPVSTQASVEGPW